MFKVSINTVDNGYYIALSENKPRFSNIYNIQQSKLGIAKQKRSVSQENFQSNIANTKINQHLKEESTSNKKDQIINTSKIKLNKQLNKNGSLPDINKFDKYNKQQRFLKRHQAEIALKSKQFKSRFPSFNMYGNLLKDN